MLRILRWAVACALGWMVVHPFEAKAQALQIQPLVVEIPAGQRASTISLENKGTEPTTLQVRALAWIQTAAGEQLASADDRLAFSPPFATVPPGGTQVIRLVLLRPPTQAEEAFQLVVDQIPRPSPSGTTDVQLQFRIQIPVFAEADPRAKPEIVWHLTADGATDATLTAANRGTKHLRVGKITLSGPDGRRFDMPTNGSFYVLPGVERSWHIARIAPELLRAGTVLHLAATGEHGPSETAVTVGSGP